jgi:dynactin-6
MTDSDEDDSALKWTQLFLNTEETSLFKKVTIPADFVNDYLSFMCTLVELHRDPSTAPAASTDTDVVADYLKKQQVSGGALPVSSSSTTTNNIRHNLVAYFTKLKRSKPLFFNAIPGLLSQMLQLLPSEIDATGLQDTVETYNYFIKHHAELLLQTPQMEAHYIDPSALVVSTAVLKGDVRIGSNCVCHPWSRLEAINGPILLGEGNCVEEFAVITNTLPPADDGTPTQLVIGKYNTFEVQCRISARSIGNSNLFERRCIVGNGAEIGDGCIVGVLCQLQPLYVLPSATVIYGAQNERIHHTDLIAKVQQEFCKQQVKSLAETLPPFHNVRGKSDSVSV